MVQNLNVDFRELGRKKPCEYIYTSVLIKGIKGIKWTVESDTFAVIFPMMDSWRPTEIVGNYIELQWKRLESLNE